MIPGVFLSFPQSIWELMIFHILASFILLPIVYHNESNGLLFGKRLTFSGDHMFLYKEIYGGKKSDKFHQIIFIFFLNYIMHNYPILGIVFYSCSYFVWNKSCNVLYKEINNLGK